MKIRGMRRKLCLCNAVQRYGVVGIDSNYRARAAVMGLTENLCDGVVGE
jgi:hypothetical protein